MSNHANLKKGRSPIQQQIEARQREKRACEMVLRGIDYATIAQELGWQSAQSARNAVKRALANSHDPEVEQLREQESIRLRDLMRRLYEELERDHYVVDHGQVVTKDGQPLRDSGAVVAIIREIRMLSAEFSKLRGLHAPMRVVVEEITQTMVEAEIARIESQAAALELELRQQGIEIPELDVIDAEVVEDE